jgi:hypothetical protein
VRGLLTNPAYAGAFVFGRRRQEKSLGENGRVVTRRRLVPRSEWGVCILNHHPGYITWDTYLENQDRLAANRRPERGEGGGAPREGRALLQGLVRCGRCGRRMQVTYPGTSTKPHVYVCARASAEIASPVCQRIGGRRVDEAVLDAVFEALEPASLQVTAKALADVEAEHERSLHAFEVALERTRFEAERARRQFDAVEPENRLVARNLEAEWEARLVEVSQAEAALNDRRARRPVSLTVEEVAWLERAGADLRAVFEAQTTTMTERKQLLRLVLAEVIITANSQTKDATVRICFEGGTSIQRSVPHPRPGNNVPATDEDTVELVRRLASHYNDTLIAQILSRQGRKTATGLSFTRERVNALRHSHGIAVHQPCAEPKQDGTFMSLTETARALGVSGTTLYRWLREGFIAGTQLTPGGPWHIHVDDELRAKIVPDVPPGWVRLQEAARALGVARQTVLDRVRRGELRAVHVKRGQRSGLAIEIAAANGQFGRLFG